MPSALAAMKSIEDIVNPPTARFLDALKPAIVSEQASAIGAVPNPLAGIGPRLTEVIGAGRISVKAEPFTAVGIKALDTKAMLGTLPVADYSKVLEAAKPAMRFAGSSNLASQILKEHGAFAGLSDQILGLQRKADAEWLRGQVYRTLAPQLSGARLRTDLLGALGPQMAAGNAEALSMLSPLSGWAAKPIGLEGLVNPGPALGQILPTGIKNFMDSSIWPDTVLRGFGIVRRAWERLELEARLKQGSLEERLVFVIDYLAHEAAIELLELLSDQGIDPMLNLLERVLVTPESIALFREMIKETPGLRPGVRKDLTNGLDHLEEDDFHQALPDLSWGLEGAFRDGARTREPWREKRMANAQSAIKIIGFPHERFLFLKDAAGESNDARHGEEADRRALSLLCLVAVLCLYEEFTETLMIRWLADQLAAEIEREMRDRDSD